MRPAGNRNEAAVGQAVDEADAIRCDVVIRAGDEQRVLDTVLGVESVVRASSSIALTTFLDHRTLPVFVEAAG